MDYAKTPCSEFPNDNPDLHEGSVWYAADEDESALDSIEIVDELSFDDAMDDEPATPQSEDPFMRFVAAIETAAAVSGGGPEVIAHLRATLGVTRMEDGRERPELLTRQVLAWQDILRGNGEDYSACGPLTLDEWAADLVAGVLGNGSRRDAVRRELRKHGVAAFGLLAA